MKKPKYSEEFVSNHLNEHGYTLLSPYKNTSIPVRVRCPKGHEYPIRFNDFYNRKRRCRNCRLEEKKPKYTAEFAENYLREHGYTLLSEYIDPYTHIQVRCPNDHEYPVCFAFFYYDGRRCKQCRIKYPKEFAEPYIKEQGYTLLSEYRFAPRKILLLCPNEHEWPTTFIDFYRGTRCGKCQGKGHYTHEYVAEILKEEYGLELLSTYEKASVPVMFRCTCGGIGSALLGSIYRGARCQECLGERWRKTRIERKLKKMEELYGGSEDGE